MLEVLSGRDLFSSSDLSFEPGFGAYQSSAQKIKVHLPAFSPSLCSFDLAHSNSWKKRSENAGANENLSGGFAAIPGITPRVAPRIVVFALHKSWDAIPRMGFRIPSIIFWTLRAAPRIPTPELSQSSENSLFTPRAFFLKKAPYILLANHWCISFVPGCILVIILDRVAENIGAFWIQLNIRKDLHRALKNPLPPASEEAAHLPDSPLWHKSAIGFFEFSPVDSFSPAFLPGNPPKMWRKLTDFSRTVTQPHHLKKGTDSHLACEPVYKPNVCPRFVVNLPAFVTTENEPNSQKRGEFIHWFADDMWIGSFWEDEVGPHLMQLNTLNQWNSWNKKCKEQMLRRTGLKAPFLPLQTNVPPHTPL